ncbi:MAG: ABC transporter [Bacteroidetes bacterium GWA2_32_17]|nr:MAG: ABC transporter [Bacteroidetes bacterium GWA2_32_17]
MAVFNILFRENFKIAIESIKSNRLRTVLTILIIAFGIMALVGILTAIESIKSSLNSNFTSLGANTFRITSWKMMSHGPGNHDNIDYKDIDYRQAVSFNERYDFPAIVSISNRASSQGIAKYKSKKTNPNIAVFGIDENYFVVSGYEIDKGRNFSPLEVQQGAFSIVIGQELVKNLFGLHNDPLNKDIMLGGCRYKIVGAIKAKGTSMGGAGDKICFIPITNARQNYSENKSYTINIMPSSPSLLDIAISEAEGIFRMVRGLKLNESNNFEISKSDTLANMLMENISYVTIAATLIGIITLLGASIGLMNIMLVSVSERTREIGTRKALGANSSIIKQQFLFEAVFIGQLGGIFGIIFGIIVGNLISLLTEGSFVIPWMWILFGFVLCFVVGLVSGLIPAIKASKLDPIEALRYE